MHAGASHKGNAQLDECRVHAAASHKGNARLRPKQQSGHCPQCIMHLQSDHMLAQPLELSLLLHCCFASWCRHRPQIDPRPHALQHCASGAWCMHVTAGPAASPKSHQQQLRQRPGRLDCAAPAMKTNILNITTSARIAEGGQRRLACRCERRLRRENT